MICERGTGRFLIGRKQRFTFAILIAEIDEVSDRARKHVFLFGRKSGKVDGHKAIVRADVPQLDALVAAHQSSVI